MERKMGDHKKESTKSEDSHKAWDLESVHRRKRGKRNY